MQFVAFGHLDARSQFLVNDLGKGFTRVAAINQ